MNKKTIITLSVIGAVVVIGGIIYYMNLNKSSATANATSSKPSTTPLLSTDTNQVQLDNSSANNKQCKDGSIPTFTGSGDLMPIAHCADGGSPATPSDGTPCIASNGSGNISGTMQSGVCVNSEGVAPPIIISIGGNPIAIGI